MMKTLLAFCLIGAAFASCGTIETMTAESNDTTVVVTAAAPMDTLMPDPDSVIVTIPDSIQ